MQFGTTAALKTELREIKQIELSGEDVDLGRRAPLATVARRPRFGVSQWMMRLVSVKGRVRRIRPVLVSIMTGRLSGLREA